MKLVRIASAVMTLAAILLSLAGCNSSQSPSGSHDTVAATASISGTVRAVVGGSGVSDTLTFNTSDGKTAKDLQIITDLSTLPAGWTASPQTFSCATVSTGSGCLLDLTFTPTASASGTLWVGYTYVDNAGRTQGGSVSIPYAATTNDNVNATVSPAGQIATVVGSSEPITVTFDTDDGNVASNLAVTSSLSSLPSGWSSTSGNFACSSVSIGNACQLALTYKPTQSGTGTLTLDFSYTDNAGTAKNGVVDIPYSATTNDNAVVAVNPAGTVSVNVGSSQTVTVSFTTDDGNTATGLSISTAALSSLPGGWSSASDPFYCATFASGAGCRLTLTYVPPASASGTIILPYGYQDNAGVSKTGTLVIPYTAVQLHAYVTDSGSGTVDVCSIGSGGLLSGCVPTGSGFSGPSSVVFDGSDAYVADTGGAIYLCQLTDDGNFSGCASAASGFQNPGLLAVSGTWLYAPNGSAYGGPQYCSIGSGGALSACALTDAVSSSNQATGVAFHGSTAYVTTLGDSGGPGVLQCTVDSAGDIPNSGCVNANTGLSAAEAVSVYQSWLYVMTGSGVMVCTIGSGGTLSACSTSVPFSGGGGSGTYTYFDAPVTMGGGYAYIPYVSANKVTMATQSGVAVCTIGANGALSGCIDSGATFSDAVDVAVH